MQLQLEVQIREFIGRYYEGWMVCNDSTCGNRTRMMGVYGRNCLKFECKGRVSFEVRLSPLSVCSAGDLTHARRTLLLYLLFPTPQTPRFRTNKYSIRMRNYTPNFGILPISSMGRRPSIPLSVRIKVCGHVFFTTLSN
jgi:hypothetical protein